MKQIRLGQRWLSLPLTKVRKNKRLFTGYFHDNKKCVPDFISVTLMVFQKKMKTTYLTPFLSFF